LQSAFKGKVRDGVAFARDPWQRSQPLKVADNVAEVSEPSHDD
jgi:hypothetical protein